MDKRKEETTGTVYFVGAGPGDPDLITLRGKKLLTIADCIIYAGSLVNPQLLSYARPACRCYNSAALTLEEILHIMCKEAAQGHCIVRLHTGDPSLYGAIREQIAGLRQAAVPFFVIPGVSSFTAAAAAMAAEYTVPGISQSVIITRYGGRQPGAARKEKLPVVTEIMSADKLDVFLQQEVDIIQIGARNMQNFELLRAVGKTRKPILLKRGLSATIEEWLMAAEYIMAGGNPNVILCERGIRTYETYTRNTLDLSAVLAVKRQSHLPIIVDPSHATGKRWMVPALAKAAIVAGADGIMVEVHNNPSEALCDGEESITPDMFDELMQSLRQLAPICGREL